MSASPPDRVDSRGPTALERVLLGLLGAGVAVAALWFCFVVMFIVALTIDCNGPHGTSGILVIASVWAAGAAVACVPWLVAISLLRVAAGRRWLRGRSWIAAPLALAIVAGPVGAVAAAKAPPPSATCQPFSLD